MQLQLADQSLEIAKNTPKAQRLVFESSAIDPFTLGLNRGQYLKVANTAYYQATLITSDSADAHRGWCTAQVELDIEKDQQNVVEICRNALILNEDSPETHLYFGIALSRQERWSEAEAPMRQYLALTPQKGNGYYQLGKVLFHQQKFEDAIEALREAGRLDAKANLPYELLGDAYIEQGQMEEAISAYRQSLRASPAYPPAYFKLGTYLLVTNQTQEAIRTYRQVTQRYPSIALGFSNLGRAYTQDEKWDQAFLAYEQALKLKPNNTWVLLDRGTTFRKKGLYSEAITDFSKGIDLEPNNIDLLWQRSLAYGLQGKVDEALADITSMQTIKPDDAYFLSQGCWLGSVLNQADQVLEFCDELLELATPQDRPYYQDARGIARALRGQNANAIQDFKDYVDHIQRKSQSHPSLQRKQQDEIALRLQWIDLLRQNSNPFTYEVRQQLLSQSE